MNKFLARAVTVNGIKFDSMKEAQRYRDLTWLERGGVIRGLTRQVKYTLVPRQYIDGKLVEREISYIADFVYQDEHGKLVVEDVKGYRKGSAYAVFVMKRKLMLSVYGIRVVEV